MTSDGASGEQGHVTAVGTLGSRITATFVLPRTGAVVRVTAYDDYPCLVGRFAESSAWLLMTASMLLRWQQDCWEFDRDPADDEDRYVLGALLGLMSTRRGEHCLETFRESVLDYQQYCRLARNATVCQPGLFTA